MKPNLHSFEVDAECDDDSLVALLEVNNINQVAAGDVIWVSPKINGQMKITYCGHVVDKQGLQETPTLPENRPVHSWDW